MMNTPISSNTESIAQAANLSPPALAVQEAEMSHLEFVQTLSERNMNADAVPLLAHSLPEEKSVSWACQSCRLAEEKGASFTPDELEILALTESPPEAADAWKNAETVEAAKTLPVSSPVYWAAQAASFAALTATGAPGIASGPSLTAQAVAGSVQLSAAKASPDAEIPEIDQHPDPNLPTPMENEETIQPENETPPEAEATPEPESNPEEQQKKANEALQPFVDLGLAIANE